MSLESKEPDISASVTPVGWKKYVNKKAAIQLFVGAVVVIAVLTLIF